MKDFSSFEKTIFTIIVKTPEGECKPFTGTGDQASYILRVNRLANHGNSILLMKQHCMRHSLLKEAVKPIKQQAKTIALNCEFCEAMEKPKIVLCRHTGLRCHEHAYGTA